MGGAAFVLVCCFLLVLLVPVVLYLLTYIFRLACSLCGIPKPSVLAATAVIVVNLIADAVALGVLEELVVAAARPVNVPRWESWIVTRFLDIPVDLAISAGLHAGLMGIKFGKGIEVWFVQRLIQLTIVAAVAAVGVVVYLVGGN